MSVVQNTDGPKVTLVVDGWLDMQSAPELAAALDALPEDIEELTLDFSHLEYISSAGIRQIVAARKMVGDKLTVRNVSPEVLDVMTMTGVAKRLNIV